MAVAVLAAGALLGAAAGGAVGLTTAGVSGAAIGASLGAVGGATFGLAAYTLSRPPYWYPVPYPYAVGFHPVVLLPFPFRLYLTYA